MAYKEVLRVEIQEVIRRWQAGKQPTADSRGDGVVAGDGAQVCVARQQWWEYCGMVRRPTRSQLSRLAGISRAGPHQVETPVEDSLAPWADQIHQWLTGDRLTVTRI